MMKIDMNKEMLEDLLKNKTLLIRYEEENPTRVTWVNIKLEGQ